MSATVEGALWVLVAALLVVAWLLAWFDRQRRERGE
jgi:hypothetical protein